MELLSMNPRLKSSFLEGEQESAMLESCLTFLASLMSVRTNIGKLAKFLVLDALKTKSPFQMFYKNLYIFRSQRIRS